MRNSLICTDLSRLKYDWWGSFWLQELCCSFRMETNTIPYYQNITFKDFAELWFCFIYSMQLYWVSTVEAHLNEKSTWCIFWKMGFVMFQLSFYSRTTIFAVSRKISDQTVWMSFANYSFWLATFLSPVCHKLLLICLLAFQVPQNGINRETLNISPSF